MSMRDVSFDPFERIEGGREEVESRMSNVEGAESRGWKVGCMEEWMVDGVIAHIMHVNA